MAMDVTENSLSTSTLSKNERKFEVLVATDSGGWNTTTNRVLTSHLAKNKKLHVRAFISKNHPRRMELAENIELLEDQIFPGDSPIELLDYPSERLQNIDFLLMHWQTSYHLTFVMKSSHSVSGLEQTLVREGMEANQFTVKSVRDDSPENLAEFITDADVLILPSRVEGFGMGGIYAISADLPVLVSGHSGVGTALKKLPSGGIHVVDSDDPKIWGQKIKEVRTIGQEIAYKRAIQLRKEYEEEYGWDDQCTKLVEKMMMKN
ncbi:unnamed protein product, partial [Porites lobata]